MSGSKVISDRVAMIAGMTPTLRPETYHFCLLRTPDADLIDAALATFKEDEGLSVILEGSVAAAANLAIDQPMRCITLNVYSALDGVGLTAAVAVALADGGIACNMVAAFHHDHAFVPADMADQALAMLQDLSEAAR